MAHSSKTTWGLYFCCPRLHPPPVFSPCSTSLHILSVSPSDVPGGFSVIQGAEPTEGGDLNLTCAANRHLYTALSWRRLHHRESTLSGQQPTSGEYSNFLALSIGNLTASHSGVYRCSARHRVSGKESHLDTKVAVISKWCGCTFTLNSTSPSKCLWIPTKSFGLEWNLLLTVVELTTLPGEHIVPGWSSWEAPLREGRWVVVESSGERPQGCIACGWKVVAEVPSSVQLGFSKCPPCQDHKNNCPNSTCSTSSSKLMSFLVFVGRLP